MTRYVALYCRISVDRSGRKEGVQAQERWGRAYAEKTWPGVPVRVFPDNDLSAAADDVVRPGYDALRAAIERGEIVHVWTVEQYRVERREIQWFEFAAIMDAAGIGELHTNRDGIVRVRDDVAGIKAVLGAGEVRRLKGRINDILADKAALGQPPGSHTFGYRHSKTEDGTKTYEQIPEQAAAIRQVAEWVLSGWSLANIAKQLQERGLRGAHGGKIGPNGVKNMVTVPTVAGHRVYRGQIVAKGNWEPILDEETWQACRLKLSQPRRVKRSDGKGTYEISERHQGNSTGRKYLLTGGLAVCGVCKHRLTGAPKKIGKRRVPYLSCHPNLGGRGCVGIILERTEEVVVDRLFDELDKDDFLNAIAADEHGSRREEITKQLAALDRQRAELATLWATPGELTMTEWNKARSTIAKNEQRLRTEYAELPPPVIDVDIQGAREAWPDMTLDEQRAFVRLFIEKVTVHPATPGTFRTYDPERVKVTWRSLRRTPADPR
ncbi:recombinase family protein [Amycolatopsis roodepoortensis]|uniref:recombinase family protein n=1 Tax=Amycolatopsis roodepoortensis TaxID=700274 RepID=UPI00214CDC8C|nr:recombinase family protein [Amycolatopsis roodepoortensis]UUV34544.1 recombinase family protein [Amycolatopsis roodepoortensis]